MAGRGTIPIFPPPPSAHTDELNEAGSLRTLVHDASDNDTRQAQPVTQSTGDSQSSQSPHNYLSTVKDKAASWGVGPKVMFTKSDSLPPTVEDPLQLPGPFPLKRSRMRFFFASLDGLLALVAVAFVVFGFLVVANDGQPDGPGTLGHRLKEAASYGPTLFPMLFAAIVGRMLKAVATLLAERGSTFGRVEQLLGSSTIFGTIATQFQLGALDLVSITLLASWVFSPLGSQSALRVIYSESSVQDGPSQVTFLNTQDQKFNGQLPDTESFEYVGRPAFIAAMAFAASSKGKRAQDNNGNLRVPMINQNLSAGHGDPDAWIEINNASDVSYSSLLGFPYLLNDTDVRANSSFVLDRLPYLTLDCPVFGPTAMSYTSKTKGPKGLAPYTAWQTGNFSTNGEVDSPGQAQIAISICAGEEGPHPERWNREYVCPAGVRRPRRRLVWESMTHVDSAIQDFGVAHVECDMRTAHVDVEYACDAHESCEARRVRRSAGAGAGGENATFFDRSVFPSDLVAMLTTLFTAPQSQAAQSAFATSLNPVVGYLAAPDDPFALTPFGGRASVLAPGRAAFETRLAQLLNSAYMLRISPSPWSAAERPAAGAAGWEAAAAARFGAAYSVAADTLARPAAVSSAGGAVVRCDWPWFAVLLASGLALVAAALASMVVRARLFAPDLLGSLAAAASLDNRYAALARGGTALDGMDRARLMRHVPLRISDVNPGGPVGRIALAGPGDGASLCAAGARGRMYE